MFDNLKDQQNKNKNQQPENQQKPEIQPQAPPAPKEDVNQRMDKLREKGVKQGGRKKLYSIIGIVAILFFVGGVAGAGYFYWDDIANIINERFNKDTSDELILLDEWKVCSQDLDCVETQESCCNCANGGIQAAINKQYLNQWQNILDNSCQDVGCLAFVNCKQGRVVCENNKCEFKIEEEKEDCAKEGEIFSLEYDQKGPDCCEGLNKKAHFDLIDDECAVLADDMGICINCPNGECGAGENKCNCPEDCMGDEKPCVLPGKSADEYSFGQYMGLQNCCAGLVKIDVKVYENEKCYHVTDSGTICSDCGNLICEEWENKCNCPEDCEEEFRVDTDNDGLFDDEEAEYGTDINNPDSDVDGYLDGDEVENGYDPMGEGRL